MAKVGIDFGTSNSSVMIYGENKAFSTLLKCEGKVIMYAPSLIRCNAEGNFRCGWDIPEAYIRRGGDVVENLKTALLDDTNNEMIKINENAFDKWKLFQKYMEYLVNLANKSEFLIVAGEKVDEVVLSYPHNSSVLYRTNLKENVETGSYIDADGNCYSVKVSHMQEEPVAIALSAFAVGESNAKILVCDIGGGTTDFAVVEKSETGRIRVIDHEGLSRAGNYLDDLIIKGLLPHARKKEEKKVWIFKNSKEKNISQDEFFEKNKSLRASRLHIRKDVKEQIEKNNEAFATLWLEGEPILRDYRLTEEEYKEMIEPFVNELILKAEKLVIRHDVEQIILAGGCAQSEYIRKMMEERLAERLDWDAVPVKRIFSDIPPRDHAYLDEGTATAAGNAKWFTEPKVVNILNYSYGVGCYDPQTDRNYISIFFHRNEELPITERKIPYWTTCATDYVTNKFYKGMEKDKEKQREYDFSKQEHLAGKDFIYHFGKRVPAHTPMDHYYSMTEDGVLTMRVESEQAAERGQTCTLTGLE